MFLHILLAAALPLSTAVGDTERRFVVVAPAETLAVTVDGGDGRAVVMVPGLLGAAYTFRHVRHALAEAGLRVVVVEPLGTGASSRPKHADYSLTAQSRRIEAALDSLRIDSAILVCHAVGASMCFRMAARRPEQAAGIVSLNGGAAERAGTPGLRSALRYAPVLSLFGAEGIVRDRLAEGLVASSYDPAWVTEEVIRGYTAPFDEDLGGALDALQRMMGAAEPEPLRPLLRRIRVPVRLLMGAGPPKDIVPPAEVETLREELEDFRVELVHRSGQYIQEERPAAVVRAIVSLLAEIGQAST